MRFKLLSIGLALVMQAIPSNDVWAGGVGRRAVVYYSEGRDERATYIKGELQSVLAV